MKLFKLFGKSGTRHVPETMRGVKNTEPSPQARDTVRKIDAIEFEMTAEFRAGCTPVTKPDREPLAAPREYGQIPDITSNLQNAIEEAAILHASQQSDLALQLLLDATAAQDLSAMGKALQAQEQLAWWMMFDLCQLDNLQQKFEQLALAYASRFETSPPQWNNRMAAESKPEISQTLPSLNLRGALDAHSMPLLERIQQLAATHQALYIECSGITEVDLDGCALFLRILRQIESQQQQLSIANAVSLTEKIRELIKPGRRDDNDAGWLLLIALLQLLNNEKEHEEVCLEYCVTYEVSPPAFVPPAGFTRPTCSSGRHFALPQCIAAPLDPLWDAVERYAADAQSIVLDASQLTRIDFTVAAPLVDGLLRLHAGKPVELRNANFVVSVLLQLVGGKDKLPILTRKL